MKKIQYELAGQIFGNWKVLRLGKRNERREYFWVCKCLQCGSLKEVRGSTLRNGTSTKCRSCASKYINIKHGDRKNKKSPYSTYMNMLSRCTLQTNPEWKNYGGRGIKICSDWLGENGYINFRQWAYSNGWQKGLSIERMDVNGNYCPNNCCWIAKNEQAKNRRMSIRIKFNGATYYAKEFASMYKINHYTFYDWIHKYGLENAINKAINR